MFKDLISNILSKAGNEAYDQLDQEVEKKTGWQGGFPTAVDTLVKGGIVIGSAILGAFLASKFGG